MANTNSNMHKAKSAKNDEFYTMLTDIEKEMKYYRDQFKGKTIYCNCDDARESNFFKYFSLNFEFLGLRKLISTGYKEDGKGVVLIYEGDKNGNRKVDDEEIQVTELEGDGDFRSEECIQYLKEADIVVTNPPFSLFREYVAQLMEYGKKFCIIGNKNAIKYKETFQFIKDGQLWIGKSVPNDFKIPNGEITKSIAGLCRWFTNLETNKHLEKMTLCKEYNETDYPKYDNYNAIECGKVVDIPYGYDGYIGVPITIADKVCSDGLIHFESPVTEEDDVAYSIVGMMNTGEKNEGIRYENTKHGRPLLNGKELYTRLLIQKVK